MTPSALVNLNVLRFNPVTSTACAVDELLREKVEEKAVISRRLSKSIVRRHSIVELHPALKARVTVTDVDDGVTASVKAGATSSLVEVVSSTAVKLELLIKGAVDKDNATH